MMDSQDYVIDEKRGMAWNTSSEALDWYKAQLDLHDSPVVERQPAAVITGVSSRKDSKFQIVILDNQQLHIGTKLFTAPPELAASSATSCPGHGRPECATCCWPAPAGYTAVDMSTAAADGYRDAVEHGFQRVAEVSVTNIDPHYPNPGRQVYVNWLWDKEDIPHGTLLYVRTDRSIGS